MSDQSQTEGQPPEATESQQADPPEWLGPIQERMTELGEQTSRMAEQFSTLYEGQQQQPTDEGEADQDFDYFDAEGELTPEGAQAMIDQRVDDRLSAALSKRDAVTALEQREDAFEALRDEIPALQDEKMAARLVRDTADYLKQHGREDVIETPMFVDMIEDRFYREAHHERVQAEREQQPDREVVLESASGATQPQAKNEPDWGERIVKAAERLRPGI